MFFVVTVRKQWATEWETDCRREVRTRPSFPRTREQTHRPVGESQDIKKQL